MKTHLGLKSYALKGKRYNQLKGEICPQANTIVNKVFGAYPRLVKETVSSVPPATRKCLTWQVGTDPKWYQKGISMGESVGLVPIKMILYY